MLYIDIINKYKEICYSHNVQIDVKLIHDSEIIQDVIDNTIYLNGDCVPLSVFESYLSFNVRKILLPQLELETSRLILRRFRKEDACYCFEFLSDKDTCLDDGGYLPFKKMDDEYNNLMDKFASEENRFMIYSKEHKKVIGTINLIDVLDRSVECKEIGYVVSPNYRRKGYAFEAVNSLINLLLDELGLEMIIIGCFEDNIASKNMIEKLGFTFEGRKHKALWHAVEGPKDLLYFYKERTNI